jgi:hypothetical protein
VGIRSGWLGDYRRHRERSEAIQVSCGTGLLRRFRSTDGSF